MFEDYAKGSLYDIAQNYTYANESGISAVALSPNARFLYSADYSGDAIWTHWVDEVTGFLTYHSKLALPAGSAPSALVPHPMGQYLFTVLESSNELLVLSLGWNTALPAANATYSLLPNCKIYALDPLKLQLTGRPRR
jgi:carboxy-cis,cis-muconate cyclase